MYLSSVVYRKFFLPSASSAGRAHDYGFRTRRALPRRSRRSYRRLSTGLAVKELEQAPGRPGDNKLTLKSFFASGTDAFAVSPNDRPWDLLQQLPQVLREAEDSHPAIEGWHIRGTGPVSIGPHAEIWPGVVIVAPAIIEDHVKILPGALVSESWIGSHAVVGHCAEVTRSVIFREAHLGDKSTILDSIIGAHARISGGNAFANITIGSLLSTREGLPQPHVEVRFNTSLLDTGLERLGFIAGDSVITPMRLSTDPATFVGPGTVIYPQGGVPLRGVWLEVARIKGIETSIARPADGPWLVPTDS